MLRGTEKSANARNSPQKRTVSAAAVPINRRKRFVVIRRAADVVLEESTEAFVACDREVRVEGEGMQVMGEFQSAGGCRATDAAVRRGSERRIP